VIFTLVPVFSLPLMRCLLSFLYFPAISVILSFVSVFPYESKHRINGRENTGTKVNITLMLWKYRNESKFHTNGRENKGTKVNITPFVTVFPYH
jgi:hypothetical protein